MKLTLPEMVDGQTDWKIYGEYQSPVGRDPWLRYHRIIFRVLMYCHDRAENLWHWIWRIAQPFAEPRMRYETKYHEMKVLKREGSNLTVDNHGPVVNGAPIYATKPTPRN